MKRFGFLFGNTMEINGIKKDVERITQFLKSRIGGAGNDSEIKVEYNLSQNEIRKIITDITAKAYDYVFLYYSRHGCSVRGPKLYLNNANACIKEDELFGFGLSKKQLMIYDCCRVSNEETKKATHIHRESFSMQKNYLEHCRQRYETLIAKASEQQVTLYACKEGQCAYDTVNGGVYTQQLIDHVIATCRYRDAYIDDVHRKTTTEVKYYSIQKGISQNPEMDVYCSEYNYTPLIFGLHGEVNL